ncbi:ribosome biogenesis protein Kri1 [Pyricularia oryzae 70-15]|uniref:Ribosome biogenesis protein Kri1 n=3 Tax=Pyricularia oryzae TaxID=318829 RepID=G4N8I5_PYRO7|nr:ribosome biogenesis protein Kri1 [Pyricularia oryzae 70-15]EHA51033.1 ribosome biogenesis protein Kri1 [Pyricularia oryzae 70-15]ELQ34688.1 ribosome biogenesis protein Kri1 [Pyricularia oryzae Y34]KAI7921725.1 ribosome biogenesis protein Kri1 [Pyricularia oryzae]KAI7921834.1 ribosome biogenesis protein Kri1 [Pyricularia oryzae]
MGGSTTKKRSRSTSSDSLDQVEVNEKSGKKSLFDEGDSSDDSSSGSDDDSEEGGAKLEEASGSFKINEEYARRFEHNKKREERQRLEEKHGRALANQDDEESDSEDETEDEEGFLATEDLDAEISATLQALRNKDPKIYDSNVSFYTPIDEATAAAAASKNSKDKPMTLKDYHQERYMKGDVGADFDEDSKAPPPRTYAQEQDDLKKDFIKEVKALTKDDSDDDSDGEDFLKRKSKPDQPASSNGVHPSRAAQVKTVTEADVANADKDPELFLSNFMASRAWAPPEGNRWEAFESDEEDADNANMAEEFENAYNMRFEDPEKSNEVLQSYSRTLVAAKTVRREETKGRKRQRELEKERKEAEKQERREERARLKRLKLEEAEEKLKKIKKAAGLHNKTLKEEQWAKLLDDAWDDDKWESEMQKQFGDDYYAEEEVGDVSSDEEAESSSKKRKPKKPKWDDDIDIKDIIPDFDDSVPPTVRLSDDEDNQEADQDDAEDGVGEEEDDDDEANPSKKRKTSKDHKKDRIAAQRAARQERAKLEALVEQKMELDDPTALASSSKKHKATGGGGFRYRETSPNSFGLTPRDILLAPSDAVLNEYAGLKKLATFRDPEKKRKDKKRLGKKARLRQWRRENFGREFEESGPTFGFDGAVAAAEGGGAVEHKSHKGKDKGKGKAKAEGEDDEKKSKKRKRSKGTKTEAST